MFVLAQSPVSFGEEFFLLLFTKTAGKNKYKEKTAYKTTMTLFSMLIITLSDPFICISLSFIVIVRSSFNSYVSSPEKLSSTSISESVTWSFCMRTIHCSIIQHYILEINVFILAEPYSALKCKVLICYLI